MKRYNIYVGLNDSVTHKQIFDTEKYINILKNVCKSYRVPFSLCVIQGGYIQENGAFTDEASLQIGLIGQTEETVNKIAGDLCTFFNQESVLIAYDEVKMYYVNGDSEVKNVGHPT